MDRVIWDSVIETIEGETSCMPTGIKADCEDGIYVTGFMASNRGFVRKYDKTGAEVWTKADFLDQISEVVYVSHYEFEAVGDGFYNVKV